MTTPTKPIRTARTLDPVPVTADTWMVYDQTTSQHTVDIVEGYDSAIRAAEERARAIKDIRPVFVFKLAGQIESKPVFKAIDAAFPTREDLDAAFPTREEFYKT